MKAVALSCLPWGVDNAYQEAEASKTTFSVVQGVLHFDETKLPVVDWDHQEDVPQNTRIPAIVQGRSMTSAGFTQCVDLPVTLEIQCAGPWCANAKSGREYVMFLEHKSDEKTLTANPCGSYFFDADGTDAAQQVLSCHKGQTCDQFSLD
ncbi:MAG: hypothetical protein ACU0BB_16240 [Paracoccaceae bacterium]